MTITNLNKARKNRARAKARATADENTVKFGRTKAQKAADKSDTQTTIRTLNNAKRTP